MPITESDPNAPRRKKTANRSATAAKPIANAALVDRYEAGVNQLFQFATFAAVGTNNLADAGAISQHGPNISREVAKLGVTNESVGKVLNYLTAATPYTALLAALMPLIAQIAVNHGLIKEEAGATLGTVSPQALESLVLAQKAEAEQRVYMAQKEAEARLAAIRNPNGQTEQDGVPEWHPEWHS